MKFILIILQNILKWKLKNQLQYYSVRLEEGKPLFTIKFVNNLKILILVANHVQESSF